MAGDSITLPRSMLDSDIMQDDWLCRLSIWCLLRASIGQAGLQPGCFIAGQNSAAAELHVTPSKWYRGICRLVELDFLAIEANSRRTMITVCNWATYSGGGADQRIAGELPVNSQRITEPESKPVLESKPAATNGHAKSAGRVPYTQEFEAWLAIYPVRAGKGDAAKAFAAAVKALAREHGDRIAALEWLHGRTRAFAASPVGQGQYCPYPATWLRSRKFDDDDSVWQRGDSATVNLFSGQQAWLERQSG